MSTTPFGQKQCIEQRGHAALRVGRRRSHLLESGRRIDVVRAAVGHHDPRRAFSWSEPVDRNSSLLRWGLVLLDPIHTTSPGGLCEKLVPEMDEMGRRCGKTLQLLGDRRRLASVGRFAHRADQVGGNKIENCRGGRNRLPPSGFNGRSAGYEKKRTARQLVALVRF